MWNSDKNGIPMSGRILVWNYFFNAPNVNVVSVVAALDPRYSHWMPDPALPTADIKELYDYE
jgi:hypothetical protein